MFNDIIFESSEWSIATPPDGCVCGWKDNQGLVIGLCHLGKDQALRDRMGNVAAARDHYRKGLAKSDAGLVECDLIELDGVQGVYAIAKSLIKPHGVAYIGTMALPLPIESYVFNVIAREGGITGMRETTVLAKISPELEAKGFVLNTSEAGSAPKPISWTNPTTGEVVLWAQDPYDSNWQGPGLRNMADAPENDNLFPEHPLSRVRSSLQCLFQGIKFSDQLKKRATKKAWWLFS